MLVTVNPVFSQSDQRWANVLLGFNTDAKYNLLNYGCLITCLAMAACFFKFPETPDSINEKLKALPEGEGFAKDNGLYAHGGFNKVFPSITEEFYDTPAALTDEQLTLIKSSLDQGKLVMVQLDYNPKTLTADTHYVLIVGYDLTDENNFTIADPLGGRVHSIKDYLGWLKPSVRNTIEEIYIYSSTTMNVVTSAPIVPEIKVVSPVSEPVQTPAALPANYDNIVRMSTGFKELVQEYVPGAVSDTVSLEELVKAIKDKEHTVEIQTVYGDGSADQKWSELITYLGVEKLPQDATFEDAKKKVAGYKSAQTDYYNKKLDAEKALATEQITTKNLKEDISTLKSAMLQQVKLHKVQIDSLKSAAPSFDKLVKTYEGVIADVNRLKDEKVEEVKKLRVEVGVKAVDEQGGIVMEEVAKLGSLATIQNIISLVKRFMTIKL
jgi:hypothetical protein